MAFGLLTTLLAVLPAIPSCDWDGQFTVLGYTTRPNYDMAIHTVYVPIFKNRTLWKGLEFDLTRAVIRRIEQITPYKVTSNCQEADTELLGTIVSLNKNILNRNQLNEVREAETTLAVEVVWRRRNGEVLSQPLPRGGPPLSVPSLPAATGLPDTPAPVPLGPAPAAPAVAVGPTPPPTPPPVLVQSIAGFVPEIGQSLTTAEQANVDRLAIQIVSMMEKPW
jgi:hypothetical protein